MRFLGLTPARHHRLNYCKYLIMPELPASIFCAEICTISAQNPQCLHKSLHQNQTKKARKCDKAHVATKARNHHITEAFSRQKSTLFRYKKTKKIKKNCFNF